MCYNLQSCGTFLLPSTEGKIHNREEIYLISGMMLFKTSNNYKIRIEKQNSTKEKHAYIQNFGYQRSQIRQNTCVNAFLSFPKLRKFH